MVDVGENGCHKEARFHRDARSRLRKLLTCEEWNRRGGNIIEATVIHCEWLRHVSEVSVDAWCCCQCQAVPLSDVVVIHLLGNIQYQASC